MRLRLRERAFLAGLLLALFLVLQATGQPGWERAEALLRVCLFYDYAWEKTLAGLHKEWRQKKIILPAAPVRDTATESRPEKTAGPTSPSAAPPVDPVLPVLGPVSSPFGAREHPLLKVERPHTGVDIEAESGTPIRAALAGRVKEVATSPTYGRMVVLAHPEGLETVYAHCATILVRPGAQVVAGQVIATVGNTGLSTGPHLHFEVRRRGKPFDPLPWLKHSYPTP